MSRPYTTSLGTTAVAVVQAGRARVRIGSVAMAAIARRSAQLLDADEVARGVAEGAVADAVRLVGRLLDHVGVAARQPLEGAVDVAGGEVDAGEGPLGHHLGDRAALLVGDAGGGFRRVQDDRRAGLVGRPARDPVHAAVFYVVAALEAE